MPATTTKPQSTRRPTTVKSAKLAELALQQAEAQYRQPDFITGDPIQFAHRYRHHWHSCELVSLLTCVMAYGYRPTIIQTVDQLLERMDHNPWAFVMTTGPKAQQRTLKGFVYRFYQAEDIIYLLTLLKRTYEAYGSLQTLFDQCLPPDWLAVSNTPQATPPLQAAMARFVDGLYGPKTPSRYGSRYLLPHPAKGGACKRLHMFLRWVVRSDADLPQPVDLGLWQNAQGLTPRHLLVPVDTHVSAVSRRLGIIIHQTDNWQTAEAITAFCRRLCPEDPVKYDFAFMGLGLNPTPA
jgi:uncharacterized protein (TIGR02757 family)